MIDFTKKFISDRTYSSQNASSADTASLQRSYESDRGRIINSAAVRRLQQKTQVFPLERNAAVRSRLTHSMEVMQVGRYITQQIFRQLGDKTDLYGLTGLERAFETVVEMSCLLHDVGNPPYGHFGENTMQSWFAENLQLLCRQAECELSEDIYRDLCNFEGNAQGIRVITSLQRMNLTYTQIAAVIKYTRCATQERPNTSYLQKKPGYYFAEAALISETQQALGISPGNRHPVAYVMEAADDIAYCIADIEDAVEKNIMDIRALSSRLINTYELVCTRLASAGNSQKNISDRMQRAVTSALENAQKNPVTANSAYFIKLRVDLQSLMVKHAAQRFVENIESCYHGELDQALLEDGSPSHIISTTLKEVAREYAFSHPEVESSELQGHQIICGLLDKYSSVLSVNKKAFEAISRDSNGPPLALRMFKKIAKKHINAYLAAMKTRPQFEYYYRCRMVQDHISGMTDHFAYDEYKMLFVAD